MAYNSMNGQNKKYLEESDKMATTRIISFGGNTLKSISISILYGEAQ